ncbi:MAG: DNA polymerase III subunit gamma/tau [bacterium]|nr:DNA polymerase III subunit gamma/tau [bacterium]
MSETYRALTRKYRPNSFEDIVSQDHVSNTLLNAIKQNRLSHAYMFCGPRGVGKTTMARVLARVINQIDANVDGESLNQTLNIIEMDAASNNKVEDVHHLRESVRIPPQNGRYKVFIVDEVHMLSKAAFNALLKTLEEPPEHAIFIFATTEPHKVLPTILSRVQRFDFKRISVDEIVSRLRKIAQDEHIQIDEESLHVIAKKADGALRDALGLMDQAIAFCGDQITHNELLQALNVVGTERLFEFMQCVKAKDADAGLQLINTLLQEGYDIQEFLIGLTEHLRNLYIAHHSPQLYLVEASEDTKARYKEAAKDFSRDDLMRMMHMISEAQIKLKDANQPRIQFEITLLKLIHMEKSENLAKLLTELEEVKKNFRNQGVAPRQAENGTELQSDRVPEVQSGEGNELQSDRVPEVQSGESTELQSDKVPEQIESSIEPVSEVKKDLPPKVEQPKTSPPKPDPIIAEFDMGAPALVTEVTHQAQKIHLSSNGNNVVTAEVATEHVQEFNRNPDKKITFEEVRAAWPTFLETLSTRVPKILELQVQRVKPTELNGMELTLECDNPLSQRMLKEQEMELTPILKEQIGCRLRFNPVVVQGKQSKQKASNPYERFKEIQEKDPILRELVERFGAELEY